MRKLSLITAFLFLTICSSTAQSNSFNIPFKVGIIAEYGTHIQRLGFLASFFTTFKNHEFDMEYRTYYNFKNLGPELSYWENKFTAAYTFGFGTSRESYRPNPFFKPILSHLDERFALSYGISFYFNKIGSQQSIGAMSFYVDDWIITSENDVFGNTKGRDRFRTGSLSVTHVVDDFVYSLNTVLWTGDGKCSDAQKHTTSNTNKDLEIENRYKSRYGYKDISKCLFGKFAHGILNAEVTYKPSNFFDQNYSASIGLDSENIRHLVQNKIIHDMYFLPEKLMGSKNLHYPILDEEGKPFLDEKEQVKRKDRFYFQLGQNTAWNY